MFFLIANVFYHPFQILSAETNDAIAGVPIQDLAIHEFVIDVVRTGTFKLSDPIAYYQRWRDRDRDVDVSLNTTDLMEDYTRVLKSIVANEPIECRLYSLSDNWHVAF